MQHRLTVQNRPITLPLGEPDCRFSYAVFLSREGIATARDAASTVRGRRGGEQRAPWYVHDRRQGASMSHGATIPQAAEASALAADVAAQLGCEPPL